MLRLERQSRRRARRGYVLVLAGMTVLFISVDNDAPSYLCSCRDGC
jgi:hypothetical protein